MSIIQCPTQSKRARCPCPCCCQQTLFAHCDDTNVPVYLLITFFCCCCCCVNHVKPECQSAVDCFVVWRSFSLPLCLPPEVDACRWTCLSNCLSFHLRETTHTHTCTHVLLVTIWSSHPHHRQHTHHLPEHVHWLSSPLRYCSNSIEHILLIPCFHVISFCFYLFSLSLHAKFVVLDNTQIAFEGSTLIVRDYHTNYHSLVTFANSTEVSTPILPTVRACMSPKLVAANQQVCPARSTFSPFLSPSLSSTTPLVWNNWIIVVTSYYHHN